jgi:hypothetical protein
VSELLKVSFLDGSSGTHFDGLSVGEGEKKVDGAAVSQLLVRDAEIQKDV